MTLSTYRGVQPISLELYFAALREADAPKAVANLLKADTDADLCLRSLEFVNGGCRPWPWWNEFEEWHRGKPDSEKKHRQHSSDVERVLRHNDPEVRRLGLAVLGSLRGNGALSAAREMLEDPDGGVRALAIVTLAECKDTDSIKAISKSARNIRDALLGCAVVDRLAEWGDIQLVPALIPFLDEDGFAYRYGDDFGIPAWRAQKALQSMTGFRFPLDAASCQRAWRHAVEEADPQKRVKVLERLLPEDANPLHARAVGQPGACVIEIVNRGRFAVHVAAKPSEISIDYPTGCHSKGGRAKAREDFQRLAPGEKIKKPVELPDGFLVADPATRSIKLSYTEFGAEFGVKAWIGRLTVEFGKDWNEPRKVAAVIEYWPNGNYKLKGETIDGRKSGLWERYNEAGDRIESINYGQGGSATFDPEHPANKGLGIPSTQPQKND